MERRRLAMRALGAPRRDRARVPPCPRPRSDSWPCRRRRGWRGRGSSGHPSGSRAPCDPRRSRGPARSRSPSSSVDTQPRNATGTPRRAMARAVLNWPPPPTSRTVPSTVRIRSTRLSPPTTMRAGAGVVRMSPAGLAVRTCGRMMDGCDASRCPIRTPDPPSRHLVARARALADAARASASPAHPGHHGAARRGQVHPRGGARRSARRGHDLPAHGRVPSRPGRAHTPRSRGQEGRSGHLRCGRVRGPPSPPAGGRGLASSTRPRSIARSRSRSPAPSPSHRTCPWSSRRASTCCWAPRRGSGPVAARRGVVRGARSRCAADPTHRATRALRAHPGRRPRVGAAER